MGKTTCIISACQTFGLVTSSNFESICLGSNTAYGKKNSCGSSSAKLDTFLLVMSLLSALNRIGGWKYGNEETAA